MTIFGIPIVLLTSELRLKLLSRTLPWSTQRIGATCISQKLQASACPSDQEDRDFGLQGSSFPCPINIVQFKFRLTLAKVRSSSLEDLLHSFISRAVSTAQLRLIHQLLLHLGQEHLHRNRVPGVRHDSVSQKAQTQNGSREQKQAL